MHADDEGEEPTLLVVEDDETVATTLRGLLAGLGYRVAEVVNRVDAFEPALARTTPDLVLLDIELGSAVSGLDLAARLPPHLPFVFVSAHADPNTLVLAGARRPAGFVVKPFERAQLAATLEIALAQRTAAPAMPADHPDLALLSAREREIVEHLLDHKRAPAIAKALFISPHTVRNHLKSVFAKLGVGSQQELLDRLRRGTPAG